MPQQLTTQQGHMHHTTHSTLLRNNTPPSNPSYPGPIQNKQMSPTSLIFKQNRRGQTPSPLCPLCNTEPHTTHLFNCTNIHTQLQVTDLSTASVEVGHLLVEWRGGHQSTSGPGFRLDGGYNRPVCVETLVGWGRRQQHPE